MIHALIDCFCAFVAVFAIVASRNAVRDERVARKAWMRRAHTAEQQLRDFQRANP